MSSYALKTGFAAVMATVSFASNAQWAGVGNYVNVGTYALPTLSPSPPTASSSLEFEAAANGVLPLA